MTEYTADDFAHATRARSATGWNTAWRGANPDHPTPWVLDKGGALASDQAMAACDWVPLDTHYPEETT